MLVEQLMMRPATCAPDSRLSDVARALLSETDDALPIVDAAAANEPMGLIVGTELIHRVVFDGDAVDRTAADVMEGLPATVTTDTDVAEAMGLVDRHRVPYLVVVDGTGAYAGVVAGAALRKVVQGG